MKGDRCEECRNWVPLVFDRLDPEQVWTPGGMETAVGILRHPACRFGEKPSTCVEFRRK